MGLDDNRDNVLSSDEIDATEFICSSEPSVTPVLGTRPNMMLCGSSGQDVSLYAPGLVLSSSCTPDSDTQAVLVTRDGVDQPDFDGAALRDFVIAGGVVLTEVFISDEVFSGVFCDVVEGDFTGGCSNQAPTVVQFNPDDQFWVDNTFTPINIENSGCGTDVSAFPGIKPLVGWTANTVSIAYRDRGAGRLWLSDFDWQDGDNNADTISLMGYMVTHRR